MDMTETASSSKPGSPLKVIGFIRFQLAQLSAENRHHEFEHLCRHFAREAIATNILPATGPVSSGGDQGRDFETFTTFVKNSGTQSRFFFGYGESKPLVFACSLTKLRDLKPKIQSDLETIVKAGAPYKVYYFSTENVPTALRHSLQQWAADVCKTSLELIDGQGLAEQLASAPRFWIAEEFLRVPAELFPPLTAHGDSEYADVRSRWLAQSRIGYTYSDFIEVKRGLRRATFSDEHKPDLSRWIVQMESFVRSEVEVSLQRRAMYEVCVATLRGQHDLTKKANMVSAYFSKLREFQGAVDLRDTCILLSYCVTAIRIGEFSFNRAFLDGWTKDLVDTIDGALSAASGPNLRAELLYVRAHAAQIELFASEFSKKALNDLFKWWGRVAVAAKDAPLFPVEEFADLLTAITPYLHTDERLQRITARVDAILEERSSGYAVAEKSRDRAVALFEAGNTLEAIKHLHLSKVKWFTGDTLRGTTLALLTLCEFYQELGLVYAAKYHALGAAFLIAKSSGDVVKDLLPDAMHETGTCLYLAGDWIGYSEILPMILTTHYHYRREPDDWTRHPAIQVAISHFAMTRAVAMVMGNETLRQTIAEPLGQFDMPKDLVDEILGIQVAEVEAMTIAGIGAESSKSLWGCPFSDAVSERTYHWKALGISWTARGSNRSPDVPIIEGFVATLQIVIADLANSELCLLQTSVDLEISVAEVSTFQIREVADNSTFRFSIVLPRHLVTISDAVERTQLDVLSAATVILIWCSGLSDGAVRTAIDKAFKGGLSAKVFLVRPYGELFCEFFLSQEFNRRRSLPVGSIDINTFALRESKELGWRDGKGPGYSKKKASEAIKNRYKHGIVSIRLTLQRLRGSQEFQDWIKKKREEGLLDWQILLVIANTALNVRMGSMTTPFDQHLYKKRANDIMFAAEEEPLSVEFDKLLYSESGARAQDIFAMASSKVWGLQSRRGTPDIAAWKKLLNVRYFQDSDDVPHEDLFSPLL